MTFAAQEKTVQDRGTRRGETPVGEGPAGSEDPAPLRLFDLASSYVVPRALHVIAELGVADQLGDEPRSAADLAAATGTGVLPDRLRRLLRLLAAHGVFRQLGGDLFVHTGMSLLLRRSQVPTPFEAVAGDFFRDRLPAGDTYLLMQVVHDWEDEDAVRILSAVRQAARPAAKLLMMELLFPEDDAPHPARALDVMMMVITGGRERTRSEYSTLMQAAGWRLDRIVPTSGPMSILEGVAG